MRVEQVTNGASGSVAVGAGSGQLIGDTTLTLPSYVGFPTSGQFRVLISSEIELITDASVTPYPVTRGVEGTTAAPHAATAPVVNILTQGAVDALLGTSLNGTLTSQRRTVNYVPGNGILVTVMDNAGTASADVTIAVGPSVIGGVTNFVIRNNANTLDNLAVADNGDLTVRGKMKYTTAASRVVPGATSWSLRNNADALTNFSVTDAGIFAVTPQTGNIGATASIQLGTTLNTIHQPDATTTTNFVRILQNFDSSVAGSPGGGLRVLGADVHWVDATNGLNTFAGAYINAFHDGGGDIQDFMGVIGRAYVTNGGISSVGMWGVRGDFNFSGAATIAKAVSVYGHAGTQFAGSTINVAAMVWGDHVDWTGGTVVRDAFTAYFGIPSGATGYNIGVSIGNEPASPSPTPWSAGLRVWNGGAVFSGGPTIPIADASNNNTTVYLQAGSNGGANTTLDLLYFYRSNVNQGYIGFDLDTSTFAGHVKLVTNMSIMSKNLICDNNGQLWSASTIFANAMQIVPAITTSGTLATSFTWTGPAHTTKTPSNIAEFNWNGNRTVTFDAVTGGTWTSTYTYQFQRSTYAAGTATTWTLAATMRITGAPVASTNVTFTNVYALYIDAGRSFFGGAIFLPASASGSSGYASLNVPHGAAPTTNIADGDIWTTTSGMFVRVNGVTKTVTLT